MNDAALASMRTVAEKVSNVINLTAEEYAYIYLPFINEVEIDTLINSIGSEITMEEIIEILEIVLSNNAPSNYESYYQENSSTKADINGLYTRALTNAIRIYRKVLEIITSGQITNEELVERFQDLNAPVDA